MKLTILTSLCFYILYVSTFWRITILHHCSCAFRCKPLNPALLYESTRHRDQLVAGKGVEWSREIGVMTLRGRRTSLKAHLAAHAAFSLRVSTTLERMFEQSGPPDRHTWKSRNAAICANFCAVCAHCLTRGRSRMKVFHCCSHFWYPPALYSREGLDETDFYWRSKLFYSGIFVVRVYQWKVTFVIAPRFSQ